MRSIRLCRSTLLGVCLMSVLACQMPPRGGSSSASSEVVVDEPLVDLAAANVETVMLLEEDALPDLLPDEKMLRVISLTPEMSKATYVYRVNAQSLASAAADMRIQAVWLPEGGWSAKNADGDSLVEVVTRMVKPIQGAPGSFELQLRRPAAAVELRVLLYNEGVRETARHVFNNRLETRIVKNDLGDSAGVFGAAMLVA